MDSLLNEENRSLNLSVFYSSLLEGSSSNSDSRFWTRVLRDINWMNTSFRSASGRSGNVAPMISMEGMEKRTNERRGAETFKKIMAAMDHLSEEGVFFGASCTETRDNIDEICSDEFVDMLVAKKAMVIWYFQYIPIGREPAMELMPTAEQRNEFRRRRLKRFAAAARMRTATARSTAMTLIVTVILIAAVTASVIRARIPAVARRTAVPSRRWS